MRAPAALLALSLVLAAGAGYLTSVALSQGPAEPARTVTVDVGTGEQGRPGPPGPPGPAGLDCPARFEAGVLQINAPGGQVRIWTCLERD